MIVHVAVSSPTPRLDRTLCGEEVTWKDQIAGKVGTVYRSVAEQRPDLGLVTCQRCAARMTLDALEKC